MIQVGVEVGVIFEGRKGKQGLVATSTNIERYQALMADRRGLLLRVGAGAAFSLV